MKQFRFKINKLKKLRRKRDKENDIKRDKKEKYLIIKLIKSNSVFLVFKLISNKI